MLHKKLLFRNAEIAYYMEENKGKETILMLHPAFADHEIFEEQIDFFKDQYQLILIDMPGHGESQVKGSNVTLKEMPNIISRIMAIHQIEALHVVGVSMGSLMAQAFAHRYPNRVLSMTIVGGYSIHKANEQVLKAQKKEGMKWLRYILFSPMDKFREHVVSVSCHSERCREVFRRGMQKFNRRSFSAMAGVNECFAPKDSPVPYRLLIVTGTHDLDITREAAIAMHRAETHSQLAILPEAGHCANLDSPDEFNQLVRDFVAASR